ncbi:MAG: Fis family transcriptional regulator [Spirochaetes bacterium DG_61]|nr:MAG: Fis family transcriptional regulator [Spirochaetes bacterium DG_61]
MKTVLVVDDEKNIRETLKDVLEDEGYEVLLADNGKSALDIMDRTVVDVMLLDLWLPEIGGMDVLGRTRKRFSDTQIVIISGHGTIDTAVRATKIGAFDFIEKPLSLDRVINVVDHALKISGLEKENIELKKQSQKNYYMVGGTSKSFRGIESIIASCAESNSRVFLTGENGTGKEVIARRIHELSSRRNRPFTAVNCAAIPQTLIEAELFGYEKGAFTGAIKSKRGKFELANTGTIFLDEIADMSLEAQSKVLRVLEEMQFERVGGVNPIKIDVRVISATNKDLMGETKNGSFREDLYYRLNVVPLHIPPLRERREDIPPLLDYYLDFFARENNKKRKTLSDEAFQFLFSVYHWPGNIRELKNLMERLNILTRGDVIDIHDVRSNIPHQEERYLIDNSLCLKEARENFERNFITGALVRNGHIISKAATDLKVERSNLYKLIKRLGINIEK